MKYLKDHKACLKSFQQLICLPMTFANGGFTLRSSLRPWREKSLSRSVLMRDGTGRMRGYPLGFTLIEILVVVLIIGILGAIALPQYQRAVLKSRFAALMPIAKALGEANEVFYLEHGNYSENPADLLVAGRGRNAEAYPDGTRVLMYDEDGLSYVRVTNDNVPNARYLVYQKHSENFADTTQCEASDDRAHELCVALGGQIIEDGNSSGESEWTAYLLSGTVGQNDQFGAEGNNESVDDNDGGNNSDSGTSANTEEDPVLVQLKAIAAQECPEGQTLYVCTIKDNKVFKCDTWRGAMTEEGECVSNGARAGWYEYIFSLEGVKIQGSHCNSVDSGHCYQAAIYTYSGGEKITAKKQRSCPDKKTISKDLTCPEVGSYSTSSSATDNYDYDAKTGYTYCRTIGTDGTCNPS